MNDLFTFKLDKEYSGLVIESEMLEFLTIYFIGSDIQIFDSRKEYIDDYDDIDQSGMLDLINNLQRLNTSMIELGMNFEERKEKLNIRYAQLVAKLLN